MKIAQNLSQLWLSADFTNKQQLQYLVYPEGILYSKENDAVRTPKPNTIFAAIPPLVGVLEDKKIGNLTKDCLKYSPVTWIGFEPMTLSLEG